MRNKSERGQLLVVTTGGAIVIAALIALVVDLGHLQFIRGDMQGKADAAALAAAQELPEDPAKASSIANEYLTKNGLPPTDMVDVATSDDKRKVAVTLGRKVASLFAPLAGKSEFDVKVKSTARVSAINSMVGIVPLALPDQEIQYGAKVYLKYNSDPLSGNFGGLALGGSGASSYKYNLVSGFQSAVRIGDFLTTEPGNMAGPTNAGIAARLNSCPYSDGLCSPENDRPGCTHFVTVPIVDFSAVNGSSQVPVLGFARLFIEDSSSDGSISGYFVKRLQTGELADSSAKIYGVKAVALTQ